MQNYIPPAVGWHQCLTMAPQRVGGSPSNTVKQLTGPGFAMLGDNPTWQPPNASTYGDGTGILLTSVGLGGRGSPLHCSINVQLNANNGADPTLACVSTETTQGGLLLGDPYGVAQPNSLYNVFLCGRDPSFAPNDWGIGFALGSGPNGRAALSGPPSATQNIYPYYCPIDFFWTNASANAMQFLTCKTEHQWRFVGGTLPIIGSGSTGNAWTEIMTQPASSNVGSSDNTGIFDVTVCAVENGCYADVASNTNLGSFVPARANGSTDGQYRYTPATLVPDAGGIGFRSTDPQAFVFLMGGTDAF
jgi:hypothetical protein